ncbi:hypothetical protein AH006_001022 [Salmonella enterica subsp. enterica]|nr:hypothetical protein [Salmonella enterica subsp. enterica serovar Poona]
MKKTSGHKNDRLPKPKENFSSPETRGRVVDALNDSAAKDFITLINWLKSGKDVGEAVPLARCESLRNTISTLESLKCGVKTDWKEVLKLMERTIKKSHKVTLTSPAPSQLITGVLKNLNEISQDLASGKANPEMLTRLQKIQQITSGLKGGEDLTKNINMLFESVQEALRGYTKQRIKPKASKPVKQSYAQKEDKVLLSECEPLIGLNDIFMIANCLISMATRMGCSPVSLAKRVDALKVVIDPENMPVLLDLLQQDVEIMAKAIPEKVKDDNSRSDGGKLMGQTGIVEGGYSIGVEAQRIITAELKRLPTLTNTERIYIDTARSSLALECDAFKAIEEVKRIAARLKWRPLAVAAYIAHKSHGIRTEITGDVITLLAQDEALLGNCMRQ